MMRPLLVNTYDQTGGAARAAYRLSIALRREAVNATLLVRQKRSRAEHVVLAEAEWQGWLRAYLDFLRLKAYPARLTDNFTAAGSPDLLSRWVGQLNPDLVHLHWVSDGFLKIETLQALPVPVIWTLHDSWAFTGGCHLPGDCQKYTERCGACPVLGSQNDRDLSRKVWLRKQQAYAHREFYVVSPSRWLAENARRSALLQNARIEVIPNAVDTALYSPGDRSAARAKFGFAADRKVLLFGARHALSDRNKGSDLLWQSLALLPPEQRKDLLLVVFGEDRKGFVPPLEIETVLMGEVESEAAVADLYRSADLMLMTSRQENLPNMISEAMACGLPTVAFAVGGLPDQLQSVAADCLVEPYDVAAMARQVAGLLTMGEERLQLAARLRSYAVANYSLHEVASRHIALYKEVLDAY